MELGLSIENRKILLERGSEHPKLNELTQKKYISISAIFQSFKIVQKEFQENREGNDGRWESSPVFYNPTITKRTIVTTKKEEKEGFKEVLRLGEYNIPLDINVTVRSMFEDGKYLYWIRQKTRFGNRFGILNYISLKQQMKLNYGKQIIF